MAEKLLTISILVSGRRETTEKCLESLQELRDAVDSELILVDTGCGEELQPLLQKYADKIVPFAWCSDFAKARNAGLYEAKGEWFLYVDDDEWFSDVKPIIDFFQSGEYKEYDQAVYKQRNYSDSKGSAYVDDWASRMIKLEKDTRFVGKIHESLMPARGKCRKLDAFVHHYGYVYATEEERMAHADRNISLLLEVQKEEPNNLKWPIQLVQEYSSIRDYHKLADLAESSLVLLAEVDQPFANKCRGTFFCAALRADMEQGAYKEAEQKAKEYWKDPRNTNSVRCSLDYMLVQVYERQEDAEQIIDGCKQYLEDYEAYRSEEKTEQEQIIEESVLLVKDGISSQAYTYISDLLMVGLLRADRLKEIPEKLLQDLQEDLERSMNGNAEFLMLSEDIWRMAEAGLLPLEEMILKLPLSQWMVLVMVLEKGKNIEPWLDLREHLTRIQTCENIRYDYFYMHVSNATMITDISDWNYQEASELFLDFARANLKYAHQVYTEAAFEDEMVLLPESCKCAVWMEQVFSAGEYDWNAKLKNLKKCIQAWPQVGNAVKHYIELIGIEQDRQSQAAESAQDQLQGMAAQIIKQVDTLCASGMYVEALGIVQQLRQMLPEDEKIMELEKNLQQHFS